MNTFERIRTSWDEQADEYNKWDALGDDEKIEWAIQCVSLSGTEPHWKDGEPANLLAAGEDAYAWLSWLQQHAWAFLMKQEDQSRLENCMVALNSFLRPNT